MSTIIINKITIISDDKPESFDISFSYLGKKIYSASTVDKIIGVFTSDIIAAPSNFIRWDNIEWSGTTTDFNIAFFVRDGITSDIYLSPWKGPFYDNNFNISSLTGQYLQFMIVLVADQSVNPLVDSVDIKFISSQDSVKFYTKLFNLGFSPKNILLTYNSDDTTDSVVRFAVAAQDTTNTSKYQFIEPGKITDLVNLSPLASGIKLMIDISGNSGIPVKIHEVAFVVGGDEAARPNKGSWG